MPAAGDQDPVGEIIGRACGCHAAAMARVGAAEREMAAVWDQSDPSPRESSGLGRAADNVRRLATRDAAMGLLRDLSSRMPLVEDYGLRSALMALRPDQWDPAGIRGAIDGVGGPGGILAWACGATRESLYRTGSVALRAGPAAPVVSLTSSAIGGHGPRRARIGRPWRAHEVLSALAWIDHLGRDPGDPDPYARSAAEIGRAGGEFGRLMGSRTVHLDGPWRPALTPRLRGWRIASAPGGFWPPLELLVAPGLAAALEADMGAFLGRGPGDGAGFPPARAPAAARGPRQAPAAEPDL